MDVPVVYFCWLSHNSGQLVNYTGAGPAETGRAWPASPEPPSPTHARELTELWFLSLH